jgi:hypothetical protein
MRRERRKEKERRDAKTARREAREKKKEEQQKFDEKLQRKEERRLIREERAKRRATRAKEEEKKTYNASSSELSSSSDDGDDDVSYHASKENKKTKDKGKKKDSKDKGSNTKKKYAAISFNHSYLSNRDRKSFINVPTGKLPHFDGTNFAKWKHLMRAYLIGLHPGLWEIVCSGFQPPKDPEEPTNKELAVVHLNGQATSILLSALDENEYGRVMNVDVAKQIWPAQASMWPAPAPFIMHYIN